MDFSASVNFIKDLQKNKFLRIVQSIFLKKVTESVLIFSLIYKYY